MFGDNSMHIITKTIFAGLALSIVSFSQANSLDDYWNSDNVKDHECQYGFLARNPIGLARCMQAENINEHLKMLNDIAGANNGTRVAASPGYDASVDYIKSTLEQYGYDVELQAFPFSSFDVQGPGTLEVLAPAGQVYEWDVDATYMSHSEAGSVSGMVTAIDLALGLDNQSSSGCEIEDFTDFNPGHIALIQRGSCSFQQKAENAATAGAVGVIIFNQGNTQERKALFSGTLSDGYSGGVPVFAATYDRGVEWASTDALTVQMVADVLRQQSETTNIIAETKQGRADNIIMVGAHLDSVAEGPGINDNGSGSAALLEMAIQMRETYPRNKVRFAWWSAEESGLVGSTFYVDALNDEALANVKVYLNFDMIASPNAGNFIYDGDGSDFDLEGPAGSIAIERLFEQYFRLRGQRSEGTEINFRSDYAQFFNRGIPFGGLFTGAEGIKSAAQVEKFGGEAEVAYDSCYHQACDDINNINMRALEVNADGAAFVTSWLSLSTTSVDLEIEQAQSTIRTRSAQRVSLDRWGEHWIK